MTDTQVAHILRQATRTRLIEGWIQLPNGDWTINSRENGAHNLDPDCVRRLATLLNTELQ